ncbi:hypothetical protein B0H13DRAFT_1853509 [Mycena leptocephala]|nr:hypothetical protein B0H13DRAFT_1853509 [Mycena leptocephala]
MQAISGGANHYYVHVMTKGLCNLCPILMRNQIDHSTWDLSGLLSIVVTIMLYLGRLFEFKYISMFSICTVEPTQPASARKSMANGSEAIEAIRVIRSKKDQVGGIRGKPAKLPGEHFPDVPLKEQEIHCR